MVLLNTTFCIAPSDHMAFRRWVNDIYLPEIKLIENSDHKFLKIKAVNNGSLSYAIQFSLPDEDTGKNWIETSLPDLISKAFSGSYSLSPDRLLHFSTIMEIL